MNIEQRIQLAKSQINSDFNDGTLPIGLDNFSDLHDYVDANYYGGFLSESYAIHSGTNHEMNHLQSIINEWLKTL